MGKKRVVVLGGGESGYGSAVLAQVKGFDVFLSDYGQVPEVYKEKLEHWKIDYESGKHTSELILNADIIIKSPGIPDTVPIMKSIFEKGIQVVSEIEFAGWFNTAKTICITGSNGKTTTTTLVYEILKQGGLDVGLGGNIGKSFAYQVATEQHDWYVLELSSFQLDGMFDFRANVAVLMNITPDHLDRYDYQLQKYVNSKFRIIQNQGKEQAFIYCDDDPVTLENIEKQTLGMRIFPFSSKHSLKQGAFLKDGKIDVIYGEQRLEICRNDLHVKGVHNACNVMAAALSGLIAGVEPDSVKKTLLGFKGVEHRLEIVEEINGILYINDSKATNVDSVWYALESMTRPVVWIAGGTDKGNDYEPLFSFAKEKVKALVAMGVDNSKLIQNFTGVVPVLRDTHSLEEAMDAVAELALSGDVVLLSPACASFDLFKSYEDRGTRFKEQITKRKEPVG